MPLTSAFLDRLHATFPPSAVSTAEAERRACAHDNSRLNTLPDAVVFPTEHAQVEALVRACREHRVPLTARGGGTCGFRAN